MYNHDVSRTEPPPPQKKKKKKERKTPTTTISYFYCYELISRDIRSPWFTVSPHTEDAGNTCRAALIRCGRRSL